MSIRFQVYQDTPFIDLPNPRLGDGETLDTKARFLFAMDGSPRSYKYTPLKQSLIFIFDTFPRELVIQLITFLQYHGDKILVLTDWQNYQWTGKIITTPFEFETLMDGDECGQHSCKLTFVGVKDV